MVVSGLIRRLGAANEPDCSRRLVKLSLSTAAERTRRTAQSTGCSCLATGRSIRVLDDYQVSFDPTFNRSAPFVYVCVCIRASQRVQSVTNPIRPIDRRSRNRQLVSLPVTATALNSTVLNISQIDNFSSAAGPVDRSAGRQLWPCVVLVLRSRE